MSDEKTYSVALRLRRVTYEDAYVAVPVTDEIIKPDADGVGRIDFEAFVAEALRIGERAEIDWQVEEVVNEAHPLQQPMPEGRRSFDAFYDKGGR